MSIRRSFGIFAILVFGISVVSHAEVPSGNFLPAGILYPTPVGIIFPGFNIAAGVNPAALPSSTPRTAVQVAAAPALTAGDPSSYLTSLAVSSKIAGWSVGYDGNSQGGNFSHNLFSGVGFDLGPIDLGLGLRGPINGGFKPSADSGLILKLGDAVRFGAMAYNFNNSVQTTFAIGITRRQMDNVELDVTLPPFNAPGQGYITTFSATTYIGKFGTNFRASYHTVNKNFDASIGALFWVLSKANLVIEFTSPRMLTTALTFVF